MINPPPTIFVCPCGPGTEKLSMIGDEVYDVIVDSQSFSGTKLIEVEFDVFCSWMFNVRSVSLTWFDLSEFSCRVTREVDDKEDMPPYYSILPGNELSLQLAMPWHYLDPVSSHVNTPFINFMFWHRTKFYFLVKDLYKNFFIDPLISNTHTITKTQLRLETVGTGPFGPITYWQNWQAEKFYYD